MPELSDRRELRNINEEMDSGPSPAPVVEDAPEPEPTYNLPSAMTGEPEPEPVSPMPGLRVGNERDSEFPMQTPESAPAPQPPVTTPQSEPVPVPVVDDDSESGGPFEIRETAERNIQGLTQEPEPVAPPEIIEIIEVAPPVAPSPAPAAEPEPPAASHDSLAVSTLDAAEPSAMVLPASAPVSAPPAVPVVDGDTEQEARRVKFTPITNRLPAPVSDSPNPLPDKPDSVAAAEAEVKAVAADGEVTAAEAEATASAAGKVLNAAEADTPDSAEPKHSYDSGDDIARRVEEICNDPARMQELLERAKLSRHRAEREVADDDGQTVSPEARSAAGRVMNRLRQDSPSPQGADRKSRKAHISDVDLLRRAVDQCKITDPSGPIAREAKAFLAGFCCI